MNYNLIEVEEKIVNWSHDRGILTNGKATTQCLKLMSELGELADNIAKGLDTKDDIGDCFVVLTNIARLEGHTLVECANVAYDDIKDRKGFLNANGNFIKSTDPKYNQMLAEFKESQKPEESQEFKESKESEKDLRTITSCSGSGESFIMYLSDDTDIRLEISTRFQFEHPDGPIGLTVQYIKDYK